MKSPADTAGAQSESDDGDEPVNASSNTEAIETAAENAGDEDGAEATESAAEAAEDAEDAGDVDGEPQDPQGQGNRSKMSKMSKIRWIAAAVLVAVLAVAGYEGWQLFQHHQRDVAAAEAREAAEEFTLTLTTIDPNAIDANITAVIDGSTGEFKDLYQKSSAQLRQVLIDNKATARGLVLDAGIKSATKNRVEVVLFVDQAVSNATAPEPQLDRSRVVMTMEKVDGRWLASKVDLP